MKPQHAVTVTATATATAIAAASSVGHGHTPMRDQLLAAVALLRDERISEAELALQHILDVQPTQPDALHFMGVLRHTQGRVDEALALIKQSLLHLPGNATAWNNLGNVQLLAGHMGDAGQAYQSAVQHADSAPEAALALNNLCTLYRSLGRLAESETAARSAIERNQNFGDAWYNLSLTLLKMGRVHDSLIAHSHAVAEWPEHLQPRHEVIRGLMLLGEIDRAAKLIQDWLAEDANNAVAQHLLAACLQGDVPQRASDAYVEQVFDSFASSFDAKLEKLGYRAPGLVVQALQDVVGAPAGSLSVCDAGCGTGLCGPGLKPFAFHLAGCDLSAGMLSRAKALHQYDVLHKAELTHYLHTQPATFDAVVSADTLCYFGALEAALAAAHRALKAQGCLVFTVEALPDDASQPHLLQANGRYAHGSTYLRHALQQAGFDSLALRPEPLRLEAGEPVPGWLVVARRTDLPAGAS
jgi:predicted TPR repeat methyltransferase